LNFKGLVSFVLIIVIGFISVILEKPIKVKPKTDSGFSALNAKVHLDVMASEIHFMGTQENRKVKKYILAEFAKLNIPTEVFIGRTNSSRSDRYIRMSRTENIIATIKGKNSGKALVLCAHYDSVLSAPGAADDVHAVACMLEVAKLLKDQGLKNDIIFLITDGEEMGLLGAKAYTENYDLSKIGLILNYEARGNSGPSISFEWSDRNGWLVKQLKKVGRRPIASSMSFEIYNLLPNDTDYSYFKDKNVPGINHAFIDGFSYYHNPDDTPEKINLNSVQHTGENMYLLAQHFGNEDLTDVNSENASFFNLLGSLVVYPSKLDIFIIALCFILFFINVYLCMKNKKLSFKSFALSALCLLILLIVNASLAFGIGELVLNLYPDYNVFYSGQYYNHSYYFMAVAGMVIFSSWLALSFTNSKWGKHATRLGILFILSILMVAIYYVMPTAVYFISLPFLIMSAILLYENGRKNEISTKSEILSGTLISLIPFALWIPMSYMFFLAFSLKLLSGPAIVFTLIAFAFCTGQNNLWTFKNKILAYLGLVIFINGLIIAHIKSKPSQEFPLPSSLIYHYDQSTGLAHWLSLDDHINIGNKSYLENAELKNLSLMNSGDCWAKKTDIKPHLKSIEIISDSLHSQLTVVRGQEAFQTRLYIDDMNNIKQIYVNEEAAYKTHKGTGSLVIDLLGLTSDSLNIRLEKKDTSTQNEIIMSTRYKSFPIKDVLPEASKRQDGYSSIVQQIKI